MPNSPPPSEPLAEPLAGPLPGPLPETPAGLFSAGDRRPDEGYQIRIDRDGTWYYHGSPIRRMELVKLFSTVLRRDEAGDYWLVTPAERGRIQVDEVPFTAVGLTVRGEGVNQELVFRTNLDVEVTAGPDHPIRVEESDVTGEPRPYILVRDNLEARITRSVFYEMVERAQTLGDGEEVQVGLWSMRTFFHLGRPMSRATVS
jgi:hypothetical protein